MASRPTAPDRATGDERVRRPGRAARSRCAPGWWRWPPRRWPQVPGLPPAAAPVAAFAPARRARLGGSQIADALGRRRLPRAGRRAGRPRRPGARRRPARTPRPARGCRGGDRLRPDGWAAVRADRGRAGDRRGRAPDAGEAELDRLRERARGGRAALEEARAQGTASRSTELKAENADLRRKLGETRTAERQARETAEEALRLAEEAARREPRRWRPARTRSCAGCGPGSSSSRRELAAQRREERARAGRPRRGDHAGPAAARHAARGGGRAASRAGAAGRARRAGRPGRGRAGRGRATPGAVAAGARWPERARRCSSSCSRCRGRA